MSRDFKTKLNFFKIPVFVAAGIVVFVIFSFFWPNAWWIKILAGVFIVLGSLDLLKKTAASIKAHQFALDYIALFAIGLSVLLGQFLVALVIALMLASGQTLEKYGMAKARESLTALTERIPRDVVIWHGGAGGEKMAVEKVPVNTEIMVRKGEVVPLDGILLSGVATLDESSLTGEPFTFEKMRGDEIRSGTVNMGEALAVRVTKSDANSTYRKIIKLVESAQSDKAPLVRLADRYSVIFTVVTFVLATIAYLISHDLGRVLAVLVVATPCPLILATPIALFGGMNAAAKNRVLVKSISSLEVLARVNHVALDKTGTITLGQPIVSEIKIMSPGWQLASVLSVAEALERNSLHPLAKAIVAKAKESGAKRLQAVDIDEKLGHGISAVVDGRVYTLSKMTRYHHNNAVELHSDGEIIARLEFEDRLKDSAAEILTSIKKLGIALSIVTGDRAENAKRILGSLGEAGSGVNLKSDCTPEDKTKTVQDLKKSGAIVAMVGDGINDAPALAAADVGLVFSNEEHTASSEAADIVFLGGDMLAVPFILGLARRTIHIALESIWTGIGLSIIAMFFAAGGFLPPIFGAILQEGIDVLVILNALRASR